MARNSIINSLVGNITSNMKSLYTQTQYAKDDTKRDLDDLRTNMSKSIENINSTNIENIGMPTVTNVYSKLRSMQNDKGTVDEIRNVLENEDIMNSLSSTYMQNRYIREQDKEIDIICKYMPKLLEAIETRKDNVLSADHFNTDCINVQKTDSLDNTEPEEFSRKINELKDKYQLDDIIEEAYDKTSRYGEAFYYCVPYEKALKKLLTRKQKTKLITPSSVSFSEGAFMVNDKVDMKFDTDIEVPKDCNMKLEIEINESFLIDSLIDKSTCYRESRIMVQKESAILEAMVDENPSIGQKRTQAFDKTIEDDLTFDGFDDTSTDGLVSANTGDIDKLKATGCIIQNIQRHHVIPIYIDNMCLGYYYFEFEDSEDFDTLSMTDPFMSIKSSERTSSKELANQDVMLRLLSSQLSRYIDTKFINANQDLSKEIYLLMKHNDMYNSNDAQKIRVTFVPPEDMWHFWFKKDPITNRGISDLQKSIWPAKLYVCLYITNTIATLTRGQDKRVYYVKQNIDTNISKSLLNTINQIKKSNFGIRQIENINNILNITGRFNDYVIPMSSSGEAPVQFEVMQGQQIELNTDLLNVLEELAVNGTDVPLEVVQARQQMDYAVHYTMTNSKFLKRTYKRQSVCESERMFSGFITRIYCVEYKQTSKLKLKLPPPMFLNITNTSQLIDNTSNYATSIANIMIGDEEDEAVKAAVTKNIQLYYLKSFINIDDINDIIKLTKQHLEVVKLEKKTKSQTEE